MLISTLTDTKYVGRKPFGFSERLETLTGVNLFYVAGGRL